MINENPTPKETMAEFEAQATKALGSDFTMKKVYVNSLKFYTVTEQGTKRLLPMGIQLRMSVVKCGVILGILLEARSQGIDCVVLDVDFNNKNLEG